MGATKEAQLVRMDVNGARDGLAERIDSAFDNPHITIGNLSEDELIVGVKVRPRQLLEDGRMIPRADLDVDEVREELFPDGCKVTFSVDPPAVTFAVDGTVVDVDLGA